MIYFYPSLLAPTTQQSMVKANSVVISLSFRQSMAAYSREREN